MKSKHNKNFTQKCDHCDQLFKSKLSLKSHIKELHSSKKVRTPKLDNDISERQAYRRAKILGEEVNSLGKRLKRNV